MDAQEARENDYEEEVEPVYTRMKSGSARSTDVTATYLLQPQSQRRREHEPQSRRSNWCTMVDRLDRQILETIANSPSLVRTVTRREIETGVLFPSVTALDIKRNLPGQIALNLVESRLGSLERDGYIFFNEGRWWLSHKGRKELGVGDEEGDPNMGQRPVRAVLEETFTRHQRAQNQEELFSVADGILHDLYTDQNGKARVGKIRQVLDLCHEGDRTTSSDDP
jgi:hypothetical protein